MWKFLVIFALLASPAWAGKDDPEWNPPARYDHPYYGILHIYRLPQPQVAAVCKKLGTPGASLAQRGCSVWNADRSQCNVVIIDRPYRLQTPASVLRHEIGHCNGWPADHPN